jgi:hypothetical protein
LQWTPKNFVVLDNENANAHLPLSRQVSTHLDGGMSRSLMLGLAG